MALYLRGKPLCGCSSFDFTFFILNVAGNTILSYPEHVVANNSNHNVLQTFFLQKCPYDNENSMSCKENESSSFLKDNSIICTH